MAEKQEAQAQGWDAINEALRPTYGDKEPLHWGTLISYALGGPDPLDGISAYRRDDPAPHWHFVTFGLSELYEKKSDIPEQSGWGFELTFRLVRQPTEEHPPDWPLSFLQNLARYVYDSGNPFDSGHHMHLNGPIALDSETAIQAIAFRNDPELAEIDTANGSLEFLQVVGITDDEYLAMLRWNTERVLDVLATELPLLLTDTGRRSMLEKPSVSNRIDAGARSEGSSTHLLFTEHASWSQRRGLTGRRTSILLDVNTAIKASLIIPARLPFGNNLTLHSREGAVTFEPGNTPMVRTEEDDHLVIVLPQRLIEGVAGTLGRGSGSFTIQELPMVEVRVEPTLIRDRKGNVVKTIEKP